MPRKFVRLLLVLACTGFGSPSGFAKPKTQSWDLQMNAEILLITKLPEYLALARVCGQADVDVAVSKRIAANYATLYAKSLAETQAQLDQSVEAAAMNHGRYCDPADKARFATLYPDVEEMDHVLSAAVQKAGAHADAPPTR